MKAVSYNRSGGRVGKERLGCVQGIYFVGTGLWPVAHLKSFEAVTGEKTDHWLVKTVGLLIAVIGFSLLAAVWRRRVDIQSGILGAGTALALAAIDVRYSIRGVISPIYLGDAVAEAVLFSGWMFVGWKALSNESDPKLKI
jgi:hypothetical protein